jgi:hypothetical protein
MADVQVVPPIALPSRDQHRATTDAPGQRRRTLPVATIPTSCTHSTVYGMAALDCRGRIADHAILRSLAWTPGTRLTIHERHGLLIIEADPHGMFRVTGQGHLRLSAEVRHFSGLTAGDRLLLAADPTENRLTVYPPAALDTLIAAHHAVVIGGVVA